jgi:cell filamentation protein
MYAAHEDPYSYPGTDVLINLADIRDAEKLKSFELAMLATRIQEPLPMGSFDTSHYRQIHKHLFQDIYEWAGDYRTIRIAKGGNWFCYPEHIDAQMRNVFDRLAQDGYLKGLSSKEFACRAAKLLADINAIHPFRDGNGRTQLTFLSLLADSAGHKVSLEKLAPDSFLKAMIRSFKGDNKPLEIEIENLLA